MKLLLKKNIFGIFWITVLTGCIAVIFHFNTLDLFLKPLLMPLLMLAVMLRSVQLKGRNRIMLALFFSFCGDVLLMFEGQGDIYFISGLVCFLITHLIYISYFFLIKQSGESAARSHPYLSLLIGLYAAGLLYLLWHNLESLKVPVTIYACVISIMLYQSLCIPYKTGRTATRLFISGAALFVLSDSLLAVNKFYSSFLFAPVAIRLTYCLAQYFIVKGFIKKRY